MLHMRFDLLICDIMFVPAALSPPSWMREGGIALPNSLSNLGMLKSILIDHIITYEYRYFPYMSYNLSH